MTRLSVLYNINRATCRSKTRSAIDSMNATMNAKQMWLCLCLVFCSIPSLCYGCDWIANHYRIISRQSLSILRKMDGETDPVIRSFPERLYEEIEDKGKVADQVWFLAEVTEQIVKLFDDAEKWDTPELDNLQNILETRQLVQLKLCAEAYPVTRKRPSKLRRHFRMLKKILKNADYSKESWQQIRAVVKTHLMRMDIIAGHLRRTFRA
ncbi:hypothetical protein NFI96_028247 [Prochilodus magdalenae]|nr:hypothetical protein NFI96_028247 [Prochilodus magdalenae]